MIKSMGRRGRALLIAALGAVILLLDLIAGREPSWLLAGIIFAVALIMGLPSSQGG